MKPRNLLSPGKQPVGISGHFDLRAVFAFWQGETMEHILNEYVTEERHCQNQKGGKATCPEYFDRLLQGGCVTPTWKSLQRYAHATGNQAADRARTRLIFLVGLWDSPSNREVRRLDEVAGPNQSMV
jgi:hypothetical protein